MRKVVVYQQVTPTKRVEIGGAVLDGFGEAHLEGFGDWLDERAQWETKGINDALGRTGPIGFVKLDDGDRFLNVLLKQFSGAYVRAVETNK